MGLGGALEPLECRFSGTYRSTPGNTALKEEVDGEGGSLGDGRKSRPIWGTGACLQHWHVGQWLSVGDWVLLGADFALLGAMEPLLEREGATESGDGGRSREKLRDGIRVNREPKLFAERASSLF